MILKPHHLITLSSFFSIIRTDGGLNVLEKVLDQCSSKNEMFKCLKIQAIKVADRAVRVKNLKLYHGISLVTNGRQSRSMKFPLNLNESKLEKLDTDQLDDMLRTTADRFMSTHQLEIKVPDLIEEGRKKKGGGGGGGNAALYWALAIKGTFLAVAYKGIAVMSGLAIIMGKMALLLTAILGLKKLVSSNHEQTTFEIIKQPKYSESHSHSTSYDEDEGYSHHRSYDTADNTSRRIIRTYI